MAKRKFFSSTGSDVSDLQPLSGDGPVTVELVTVEREMRVEREVTEIKRN